MGIDANRMYADVIMGDYDSYNWNFSVAFSRQRERMTHPHNHSKHRENNPLIQLQQAQIE